MKYLKKYETLTSNYEEVDVAQYYKDIMGADMIQGYEDPEYKKLSQQRGKTNIVNNRVYGGEIEISILDKKEKEFTDKMLDIFKGKLVTFDCYDTHNGECKGSHTGFVTGVEFNDEDIPFILDFELEDDDRKSEKISYGHYPAPNKPVKIWNPKSQFAKPWYIKKATKRFDL